MKNYLILGLLALNLAACQKSNLNPSSRRDTIQILTKPVVGTNGSLSGTISPAGAATKVTISAYLNGKTENFTAVPEANGQFTFTGLTGGTYTMYYTPNSGYTAPTQQVLTVNGEGRTNAGTINMHRFPSGTITGKISPIGAAHEVLIFGSISASAAVDPTTGQFEFKFVPAGTHRLLFMAASGYTAPATGLELTLTDG